MERSPAGTAFLKNQVRDSIDWDVVEVSRNPTGHGAGWFGVPRQVFCYVDFLGSVAYNKTKGERSPASTRKAVRFIREFFPAEYSDRANLLVAMWRHGTVHGVFPYSYYARAGGRKVTVHWSSNNNWAEHNQAVNLKFFDVEGDPEAVCLSVNTCALADDLMTAFDGLVARMEAKPAFGRACLRRLNSVLETRFVEAKGLQLAGRREVEAQILAAPSHTEGILRGDQVDWY
jgi:hypothetical protein